MAGIYIHVPFCKVKCHYCDFHFSVQLKNRFKLVDALCSEVEMRNDYLGEEGVETIYFGGGTPSVLEINLLQRILNEISKHFKISPDCEVTLECNPDDLDEDKLYALQNIGVNRLSIGIQSFDDKVLSFMNRAHNAAQAKNVIESALKIGFKNLTIDLIYGVPNSDSKSWERELNTLAIYGIPHLSAYCLTIEENTAFGNWYKKGKLFLPPDEVSLEQFRYLIDWSEQNGMEQYEISNFSKPGYISKHNSAYWLGKKYLGIGPSAHSYNGNQRSWNISNNGRYIRALQNGDDYNEIEVLSVSDKFNDYILTRLRTKWGIATNEMAAISKEMTLHVVNTLEDYVAKGHVIEDRGVYTLTKEGRFLADAISADLFH